MVVEDPQDLRKMRNEIGIANIRAAKLFSLNGGIGIG